MTIMSDELKKTDEETKVEAPAEAEEPKEDAETSEEQDTAKDDSSSKIDYEAELQKERKRREDAEKAAADVAFKLREKRRREGSDDSEDDIPEDKPLSKADLQVLLDERDRQNEKRFQETRALEIAKANASTEAEALAAVEYWKSRVVPTGNLEEDILFALGGLNRQRVVAQNEELKRSLRSKETASHDSTTTYREPATPGEPRLAANDAQALRSVGYTWDGKARKFIKRLPGGRVLVYEPKK